jgi:phage-related minor tail protein
MDKFRIEQQEIELLKEKFKDYPEAVKALNLELLKANPEFQKLQEASAEFGKDLANELDNLALKGEHFSDFLKNISKDIEDIALKALLLKPLEDFFSGKGGSGGGGGITSLLGSLFSGLGFADGGSPPVGQLSLVGENGPELFMPSSAGTIIPNGALGGDQYYISIDARGAAPGSEEAMMRGLQRVLESNRKQSVASAIDYQRRR